MNDDIFKGNWTELKGRVQKQWGKLTNDELDVIQGSAKELSGALQKKYGWKKEEAEKELEKFKTSIK